MSMPALDRFAFGDGNRARERAGYRIPRAVTAPTAVDEDVAGIAASAGYYGFRCREVGDARHGDSCVGKP